MSGVYKTPTLFLTVKLEGVVGMEWGGQRENGDCSPKMRGERV